MVGEDYFLQLNRNTFFYDDEGDTLKSKPTLKTTNHCQIGYHLHVF